MDACTAIYSLQELPENEDDHRRKHRKRHSDSRRVVTKSGKCNLIPTNVPRKNLKFLSDLFTTLLEVRWRWILLTFFLSYFGSWTLFAVLWYLILWTHDDIAHFGSPDWTPCVSDIQNFTTAFTFSVETQQTTGYGFHKITEACPPAILLFCAQSIAGVILEGVMVGLIFVKISRAKLRGATLMFSNHACICLRDGVLTLMFRVGDIRTTHLIEATVRAQLIRHRVTLEGEEVPQGREELEVGGEGERGNQVLLFWPTTVVHRITETSPLYGITQEALKDKGSFEIVVVLDGKVELTGLNVQVRSSYLPGEILWGRRFENMTAGKLESGQRAVDFSRFHRTVPAHMYQDYF